MVRRIDEKGRPVHRVQFVGGQIEHNYHSLRMRLQRALDEVSKRIPINPQSRVKQWQSLLDELIRTPPRRLLEELVVDVQASRTFETRHSPKLRALMEIRQFVVIVEALDDELSDRELRTLVSGALHSAVDAPDASARNYQFEWFVRAVARHAGFNPRGAEPDIVLTWGNETLVLAAKRARSAAKLSKRLSEAEDQIGRSGHRGFVVLDVSHLIDAQATVTAHWSRANQMIGGALLALEREHDRAFWRARNALMNGVLLYVCKPLVGRSFRLGTAEFWWPVGNRGDRVPENLDAFLGVFAAGACNPSVLCLRTEPGVPAGYPSIVGADGWRRVPEFVRTNTGTMQRAVGSAADAERDAATPAPAPSADRRED